MINLAASQGQKGKARSIWGARLLLITSLIIIGVFGLISLYIILRASAMTLIPGTDNLYRNAYGVYAGYCDAWACLGDIKVNVFIKAEGADPNSTKAIPGTDIYFKDKNNVFTSLFLPSPHIISNDIEHFELIDYSAAKDSKTVFWNGKPIPNIDPDSFHKVKSEIYEDRNGQYSAKRLYELSN